MNWKISILLVMALTFSCFAAEGESLTDSRDGKVYKTAKIGQQIWMAENLNYDGGENKAAYAEDLRELFKPPYDKYEGDGSIGKCYNNDPVNCKKYGRLYDWAEAMGSVGGIFGNLKKKGLSDNERQGVCPAGWHLPSSSEWDKLYEYIYGNTNYNSNKVEGKLKSKSGWKEDNGTDDYGFSALPGGLCICDSFYSNKEHKVILDCGATKPWGFNLLGSTGFWWTATEDNDSEAKYWMIKDGIIKTHKVSSMSVRCVKDKGK